MQARAQDEELRNFEEDLRAVVPEGVPVGGGVGDRSFDITQMEEFTEKIQKALD